MANKHSIGSVCKACNTRLSFLDETLKYGHEIMLDAYQADGKIKGRIRNKGDTERKKIEKIQIAGKYEAKESISKGIRHLSAECRFTVATPIFVRGLYKCSANILCHNYGSATTRKEYPKLLTFVGEGEDVCPWSYAVSFANPFKRPLISEPMPILIQADDAKVIGFLHSSGIWITGAHPFCLNQHVIEAASTS